MSRVPILDKLGSSNFEELLQDVKQQSKNDQQHVLQLSQGWYKELEDRASHDSSFWRQLRGQYNNLAWKNLEALLFQFRLSPMPLLHALYSMADRMSKAVVTVEAASSAMQPAAAATARPSMLSQVNPLMTALVRDARLVDRISTDGLLYVIQGVATHLMLNLRCDPVSLTPSVRKTMSLAADSSSSSMIEALERSVEAEFLSECTSGEVNSALNRVHWLRCMEHCVQVGRRNHQGARAVWSEDLYQLLRATHLQMCTSALSPALTIALPEAQRKARARYNADLKNTGPDDATWIEARNKALQALLKKQEIEAHEKAKRWAQQESQHRQREWSELVRSTIQH